MENQFVPYEKALEIKKLENNQETNNQVSNTQVLNQTQELTEEQNEEQIPLGDKLIYAFCFITAIYFIGRFIAGIIFNV